jgi:hypothetical protein
LQKSMSDLKILGARRVARSKFRTKGTQILGGPVQNLSLPGNLTLVICTALIEDIAGTLCCTINERWIFSKSQTGGDVGVQLPS